jgi:hypothetical protein
VPPGGNVEVKMIKTGYYTKQQDKLVNKFKKTLKRYEPRLSAQYGQTFAKTINVDAMAYFIELIPRIPYYETALYRPIILLNAQLIAIVKAMKKHGKTVEEVFRIQAGFFKEDFRKIPGFMGRIYVSRLAGYFLDKMAKKGSEEGWQAEVVRGKATDDFDLSVITKKCGLVEYLKSEGMTDYLKYCNFSDFIMFPAMNIGLKQPCTIENGQCVYCMKYRGQTEIPASLDAIYDPAQV